MSNSTTPDDANAQNNSWRCFHCNQLLTGRAAAEAHFGRRTTEPPECTGYLNWLHEEREKSSELRWFCQQIFNGLDTGMLTIDSPAAETLENLMLRGRAALKRS